MIGSWSIFLKHIFELVFLIFGFNSFVGSSVGVYFVVFLDDFKQKELILKEGEEMKLLKNEKCLEDKSSFLTMNQEVRARKELIEFMAENNIEVTGDKNGKPPAHLKRGTYEGDFVKTGSSKP